MSLLCFRLFDDSPVSEGAFTEGKHPNTAEKALRSGCCSLHQLCLLFVLSGPWRSKSPNRCDQTCNKAIVCGGLGGREPAEIGQESFNCYAGQLPVKLAGKRGQYRKSLGTVLSCLTRASKEARAEQRLPAQEVPTGQEMARD